MSQPTQRAEMTLKTVVYQIPGMDTVKVQRDLIYDESAAGALTMDLYQPPDSQSRPSPVVVIVGGYPDPGFEKVFGCKFKEMRQAVCWGQLMAMSGIAAITYTNREPVADIASVLAYIRQNSSSLGIDPNRIGLWAASGNVPLALSILMQPDAQDYLKCAALCYGLTLDLDGGTGVADAARMFRFANPCGGKSVQDLPRNIALFVARAGQDAIPGLNVVMDRFLAHALACNLPLTFANHQNGPHAFDLMDDSETSRAIIRQILGFLRSHLSQSGRRALHL
jgi:hypothetical protein